MSIPLGQDSPSIHDQRIENYLHLIGFVILLWDHVLTFSMEVKYLWNHSDNLMKHLIIFNRYFSLTANTIVTVSLFASLLPPSSCESLRTFREISLVVTGIVVSALLTFRIYAIYERNNRVFGFMALCGAVLAGLALFTLFFKHSSNSNVLLTPLVCNTSFGSIIHAAQEPAAWENLFVYDCLLFTMVVYKGYKARRGTETIAILKLILRDGALYFAVMALSNLANIFTFYFAGPYTRGSLSTFSTAVSVTIISRLSLNLHARFSTEKSLVTNDSLPMTTVQYASRHHGQSTGQ